MAVSIWGGILAGLLFTILIALVNVLKYLGEIRDLLKDRQAD